MAKTIKKEFVVEGYIIKNNSILLMNHKKLDLWLPPGGHIGEHETPEEALIREIKEETGLNVEIIRQVRPEYKFNVKILSQPAHIQLEDIKGTHHHIDLIYLCRVVGGNLGANKESKDLRFFTIDEIAELNNVPEEIKYFAREFLNKETDKNQLRLPVLTEIISKNTIDFSPIKLLVIQHIKKNTIEFIKLLKKAGFREIMIIAKPYDINQGALKEIEKYAKVLIPSFRELENLKIINRAFKEFLTEENKFICLDLGGYFSRYFQNKKSIPNSNLLGVIEDTKNGIWFDEDKIKLKFPLLSVASSELKDYAENYFIAKAIVRNSENILINSDFNQTLNNKKILIAGYGKIGKNVAELLKNRSILTIHDILPIRLLRARIDGFNITKNLNKIFDFDVISSITGDMVLRRENLLDLKNGVILINGSTRKREFDINSIKDLIVKKVKKERYTTYKLYNGKTIHILADGYPVNFCNTESVPEFILDLVFAEMFMLMKTVVETNVRPGFYPIEISYKHMEESIAKIWLKYWK